MIFLLSLCHYSKIHSVYLCLTSVNKLFLVRIYFALVPAGAISGNYDQNPFNFQKKWKVKATSQSLRNETSQSDSSSARILEQLARENREYKEAQMRLMKALFEQNAKYAELASQKNKGRGKNTRNNSVAGETAGPSDGEQPSTSLFQTFRNFLGPGENMDQDLASNHSQSSFEILDNTTDPPPPPPFSPHPSLATTQNLPPQAADPPPTTTVYVTSLSLYLNGDKVDQLDSTCTKDQAMADFVRLYNTCGMANSLHSMHINYDAFMNGCFICAYDLSSSGICGSSYALPTVKTG